MSGELRSPRSGSSGDLNASDGIFVYKELHAWKFVSSRGRIADRVVTKYRRSQIFGETLELAASNWREAPSTALGKGVRAPARAAFRLDPNEPISSAAGPNTRTG
jgi:hypothetical protein